jgi:uncharacterized protein
MTMPPNPPPDTQTQTETRAEANGRPPIEIRSIVGEVRAVDAGDGKIKVRGYGLVYNKPSEVMTTRWGDKFREVIKPGACLRSLSDVDLQVDMHHDSSKILGRKSAGTATFGDDAVGTWYEADLPDTSYGRDLKISLDRKDIPGSSFEFCTVEDSWSEPDAQGVMTRTLHDIHVFTMGPVTNPAYRDTTAACRALEGHKETRSKSDAAAALDLLKLRNEFLLNELV